MRKNNLLVLAVMTAAAMVPSAVFADSLTIYMSGKPVASEDYTLTRSDDKIELSGSGKADLGFMKVDIQKFVVTTDGKFQPVSAEVKAMMGQAKMQDSITFADGKAKNDMDTGQGPTAKEDTVHPDTLVVNSTMPLSAWSTLALRVSLDTKEPQSFFAYIVGQGEVPVTAVWKGLEPVEFADRTVELNHFRASFAQSTSPTAKPIDADVWVDQSRRLIKFVVPAMNVEAYQQGYDRKAPPPPPAQPAK